MQANSENTYGVAKQQRQRELFRLLDDSISKKRLTDLHTHLMGMGSADFWVSKIMEGYLYSVESEKSERKTLFPLSKLISACGLHADGTDEFSADLDKSLFEALFFEGFPSNLSSDGVVVETEKGLCISNDTIVEMLAIEDSKLGRKGPFRALIRNCFEFLSSNGRTPMHTEVLQIYRGNFDPAFYPQRFTMKDPIIETHPEVLDILLNTTCGRYSKAGVHYIEYSVSVGDLLHPSRFACLTRSAMPSTTTGSAGGTKRNSKGNNKKSETPLTLPPSIPEFGSSSSDSAATLCPNFTEGLEVNEHMESAQLKIRRLNEEPEVPTQRDDAEIGMTVQAPSPMLASAESTSTPVRQPSTSTGFVPTNPVGVAAQSFLALRRPTPSYAASSRTGTPKPAAEKQQSARTARADARSSTAQSAGSTSTVGVPKGPECGFIPDAEIPTHLPRMPSELSRTSVNPKWRCFTNSIDRPTNLVFVFLAAFSRARGDVVYCTLQNGNWVKADPVPASHRAAYATLSKTATSAANNDTNYTSFMQGALGAAKFQEMERKLDEKIADEELCPNDAKCLRLKELAKVLCQDAWVGEVYSALLNPDKDKNPPAVQLLHDKLMRGPQEEKEKFQRHVVGLDWVGDELGHPFCIFSHDKFVDLMSDWMQVNEYVGVRIHAGEGPIRPCTRDKEDSALSLAFYLHMYILTEGIKLYHDKLTKALKKKHGEDTRLKPRIRIGHGVAFLWGCDEKDSSQFNRDMEMFRRFLRREDIVCELNPTSNHMLLPSTFQHSNKVDNKRTLPSFLKEKLPVVLATDDDGIWAIHKCKRHYHHISVAAEYCEAIGCGDIETTEQLEKMINWGRTSAFCPPAKK